jgi:TonB family protein
MTLLTDFAIRSAVVLAVGLLASGALRRRSPAVRHAVLAATLLAAPLVGPLGSALPGLEVSVPAAVNRAEPATPGLETPVTSPAPAMAATVTARATNDPGDTARVVAVLSIDWLILAWVGGSVLALGWLLLSLWQLATATRRARLVRHPVWRASLARAVTAMHVSRRVELRHSPRGDLLATWGWRRPTVLVPAVALDWPEARVDAVLRHELAHVQRYDWVIQIAAAAVRAALWWNPLAWVASRRLALHAEQACDDAVLALGVPPQTYASHLVAVARHFRPSRIDAAVSTPMARPSTLQKRIVAMLNPRLDRAGLTRRTLSFIVAGCLAVTLPIAAVRGAQGGRGLEGVVFDPTGAVLPGVHLTLKAGETAPAVEAATDAAGRFVFANVAPGKYDLKAEIRGFKAFNQQVTLDSDDDYDRAITLQVGDLQETIRVRERRTAAPQPTAGGPTPVRVGGNIKPPMKLKDVKPVYPASMRDAGREGVVPIEATVSTDGKVVNARVLTADVHPDFAVAAIEAVRGWEFTPTLLNGKPVNVLINVSVTFELED